MKTNYIFTIIGALVLFFASCEKDEETITIDKKSVVGEWQVKAYVDDESVSEAFNINVTMSNSSKLDSISISDLETESVFWDFAVNAAYSLQKESFSTVLSECQVSEEESVGVKINNGKTIGSDSIYFEILFEDDEIPFGTEYIIKGRRLDK